MTTTLDQPAITVAVSPERRAAAARSVVYAIFARLFSYPAGALAQSIIDGLYYDELRQAAADLPYPSSLMTQAYPSLPESADELQACYCALFDPSAGKGAISLGEKDHAQVERSYLWEELMRFYEHFGLEYSTERVREAPDHLVTELDFLHYLAFLEAGTEGDAGAFSRARSDFFERHLANWVPILAAKLDRAAPGALYAGLGSMLRTFVEEEQNIACA
ncbi:MAG: molecular chaperone TorD family protein [Rugosibacter sp.]